MTHARNLASVTMLCALLAGSFFGRIGEDVGAIIGLTVGLTLLWRGVI